MTEITYHRDGYGTARPAINVKDRHPGAAYHSPDLERAFPDPGEPGMTEADWATAMAYEFTQGEFWQDAARMARELDLGEIGQEGRSGGWLVLTDKGATVWCNCRTPDDPTCDWGAAYGKLSAWCDAFIADAPRKVRERARSLAIDAVASSAAQRMFGRV